MAEYVLPKFETSIEAPDHFTLKDKKIRAIVKAKYTFGKPLIGKAIVSIFEEQPFGCYFRPSSVKDEVPVVKKTIDFSGRGVVEFDIENELKFDDSEKNQYRDETSFRLAAEFIEDLTGLSQKAKKVIKIHKIPYKISIDLGFDGIKRDSSYDATVSVFILSFTCTKQKPTLKMAYILKIS